MVDMNYNLKHYDLNHSQTFCIMIAQSEPPCIAALYSLHRKLKSSTSIIRYNTDLRYDLDEQNERHGLVFYLTCEHNNFKQVLQLFTTLQLCLNV